MNLQSYTMGIKGLMKVINENAPDAVKEEVITGFTGRIVAVDASMAIYQFLVAVRSADHAGGASTQLTNEAGEVTSHLQGILYRTIRMLKAGLKPVFVFDGKAPGMKSGELEKRRAKAADAATKMKEAVESGNVEEQEKYSKRTVRMTKTHTADCQRLLDLMGIPTVKAPTEAESQCAELVKKGKVWATATEDMDALTFGTTVQLRRLTMSEARKMPVLELTLSKVLEGLKLSMDAFIDFCILCGCDYCDTVRGIGPKKALTGIRKYGTIEKFVASLKGSKGVVVPETFLADADRARQIFREPEVTEGSSIQLKWTNADEAGVIAFLCGEKGFNEDRIKKALINLAKAKKKTQQKRIDSFFSFKPTTSNSTKSKKKQKFEKKRKAKVTASKKKQIKKTKTSSKKPSFSKR